MLYLTFGPYDLETRQGRKGITLDLRNDALGRFWDRVEKEAQRDLRRALGVYVFAGSVRYNFVPWYVGQSKAGFEGEVFNASNKDKYQTAYSHDMVADQAVIFLIAKVTPKTGNLAKSLRLAEANFVEQTIIRAALSANPKLVNNKNTRLLREMEIRGVINSTIDINDLDEASKRLRKLLGIRGR